jgi:malonate transporter and related proteins
MTILLDVILPVFVLIGFGFAAARFGALSPAAVDGIMTFAQSFALPVLLFRAIAGLDLSAAYDLRLLAAFFLGAASAFAVVFTVARWGFCRSLPESVAAGFAGYFSNSLLLGLPITERAYGTDALAGNYAILSVHAPLLYSCGIIAMVLAKSQGQAPQGAGALAKAALRNILTQPLVIGILCGFALNLSGLSLPSFADSAAKMLASAAIPAALFGLGGVLLRYRPQGEGRLIALVALGSLIIHPSVTYALGKWGFALDTAALRSATVTAAMAPGVNAFLFANMFAIGRKTAASAVLIATGASILTIWGWLHILP